MFSVPLNEERTVAAGGEVCGGFEERCSRCNHEHFIKDLEG